jgi:hypothetical protein
MADKKKADREKKAGREKMVVDKSGRTLGTMKMNDATKRALLADAAARRAANEAKGK